MGGAGRFNLIKKTSLSKLNTEGEVCLESGPGRWQGALLPLATQPLIPYLEKRNTSYLCTLRLIPCGVFLKAL